MTTDIDAGWSERIKTAEDLYKLPYMTKWFEPGLLFKLIGRVIISDFFGQYADRRLIEAALHTWSKADISKEFDYSDVINPDEDGAVWIDYAADTGDGFDSTYALAYLIAQDQLPVGALTLPRGSLLILGGDEVYPTATRDDYNTRFRLPFSLAFPDKKMDRHPPVLLLPGNHDWYDGLVNFLALFCRQKPTEIGAWRTRQRRSYFAAKLSAEWWLWGIDIALIHDMDQPQADYFVAIAAAMPENANVILCSAEPGWYKAADSNDASYRTLSYAAMIARNADKDLKIPLVLSGDFHHYSHYCGAGTHYITSGGGGAFLHGTHHLLPSIEAEWLSKKETLSLRKCYPETDISKALLKDNWKFFWSNSKFSFALAGLFAFFSYLITYIPAWPHGWNLRWDAAAICYLILFGGLFAYTKYQEGASSNRLIAWLAAAHAAAHFVVILILSYLITIAAEFLYPSQRWHWLAWLLCIAVPFMIIGAPIAGTIFGLNLWITCARFGININDAFSSLRLNDFRHFLRIRIKDNTATVYPIGIRRVPQRHEWIANQGSEKQNTFSRFLPKTPLDPHLIEDAIRIEAQQAPTTREIEVSPNPSHPS